MQTIMVVLKWNIADCYYFCRFAIGCSAYEKFAQLLGIDDEKQFSVGAHFALTQLRKIGQPGLSQLTDVYHEPCIDQVEKLPSVLFGLRKRVMELLLEWPEHPSLNKVRTSVVVGIEMLQRSSFMLIRICVADHCGGGATRKLSTGFPVDEVLNRAGVVAGDVPRVGAECTCWRLNCIVPNGDDALDN